MGVPVAAGANVSASAFQVYSLPQHLVHCDHVAEATTVIQRRQIEEPKPLLAWSISNGSNKLCGSPLHPLDGFLVLTVEGYSD